MTSISALRDRLYNYIRIAEDEKIKAIYTMFEGEIEGETAWWKDNDLLQKLDKDYIDWKSGKVKGYLKEEVNVSIDKLRIKQSTT